MSTIIFSNSIEVLAENLKKKLFFNGPTFLKKQVVVVPSEQIKSYLLYYFSKDKNLQVAAGITFIFVEEVIYFFEELTSQKKSFPNKLELSLEIEKALFTLYQGKKLDDEILHYLEDGEGLVTLSEIFSQLFLRYALYDPALFSDKNIQMDLFNQILKTKKQPLLIEQLQNILENLPKREINFYLFAPRFFPKPIVDFLFTASSTFPVTHFILSPSLYFWEDFVSDFEKKKMTRAFAKKKLIQKQALDDYVKDHHPLLANWGVLGREYLKLINDFDHLYEDHYLVNDNYKTLLDHLKMDLLFLSKEQTEIDIDDSLQVHLATSKLREVQVLKNNLLTLISKHKNDLNPITPADICVFVTNIDLYFPFIQMVFSEKENPIDFRVLDLDLQSKSFFLRGFFDLFSFLQKKGDFEDLIHLFYNPFFQQKQELTKREVDRIYFWFSSLNIRGKIDQIFNENEQGSFEKAIEKLILGLVFYLDEPKKFDFPNPIEGIEISDSELIEKLVLVLENLKTDFLSIQKLNTYSKWVDLIEEITLKYFIGMDDGYKAFLQTITVFRNQKEIDHGFDFSSIFYRFTKNFKAEKVHEKKNSLEAVSFYSVKNGFAFPSRVICLLGLDENLFPSSVEKTPLDLTKSYFPQSKDQDRYLFLEIVLLAKEYLLLSYQYMDLDDGKKINPSLLLSELFSYLDKNYLMDNKSPSSKITFTHPHLYFDHSYFEKKLSFSDQAFHAANRYYNLNEIPFSSFFKESGPLKKIEEEEIVFIHDLSAFASNPVKFYFKKVLQIDLEKEPHPEIDEKNDFELSYLDHYQLKREFTKGDFEKTLFSFTQKGQMPFFPFSQGAIADLQKENDEILDCLEKFEIHKESFFSVEFDHRTEVVTKKEKTYFLPPLKIKDGEGKEITLIGRIDYLCPLGLFTLDEESLSKAAKYWPLILILLEIKEKIPFFVPSLIFGKQKKIKSIHIENPQQALKDYLHYFFISKNEPSPLVSSWVKPLLQGDENDFEKAFTKEEEFLDPYLNFVLSSLKEVDPKKIHQRWSSLLQKTFNPRVFLSEFI